jgi:adenine deaminase
VAFIRPDLAPTPGEIGRLRAVAAGREPADLAIRGARIACVQTGELLDHDLLVAGRHVAALTPPGRLPEAREDVDGTGTYLLPGFCEAHIHIEYTLMTPGEFARLVVPKGTTAVFADADCSANVFGRRGIELIAATRAPFRLFLQVSARVPRTPALEDGGGRLSIEETLELLDDPRAASYGESTPFENDDHAYRAFATAAATGRRTNGHTARFGDELLWSQLAAGIGDDHNAATFDEALERIRRGANLALHSSSLASYLDGIFSAPDRLGLAAAHIMFCADDKYADDLEAEGHIDHHLRGAVARGVEPLAAIRMATLNCASHFRVDHLLGSLTPARLADIVMVPDLESFRPSAVWIGGRLMARDGEALFANEEEYPDWALDSMNLGRTLTAEDFAIAAPGPGEYAVRVLEMYDGFYKRGLVEELAADDADVLAPDPSRDLAKFAVVDRYRGSGRMGKTFLRGFGLASGALAVSTNCSNMNVAVVGTSDAECAAAVNALGELGGGFAVVDGERVVAAVPLGYGGIASLEPYETLLGELATAKEAARSIGCRIASPFMILSFVGLAAVPEFGVTERGLIDVATQTFLSPVLGRQEALQIKVWDS